MARASFGSAGACYSYRDGMRVASARHSLGIGAVSRHGLYSPPNVRPGATLITDGHAAYPGLSGDYRHDPRVVGNMAANIVLPWSHRAFSLLKRWALGTYHGLRRKHIDAYLEEFVFRYNRRFYRHVSFETVLGLAARRGTETYRDIVNATQAHRGDR